MSYLRQSALAAALAAVIAATAAAGSARALPGNATSLREVHGDWIVSCVNREEKNHCAMSQIQADPKTRKRVVSLELRLTGAGGAKGAFVMPFGLALSRGIAFKIDTNGDALALPFATCLPAGCLVPLTADRALLEGLKAGDVMTVTAAAFDTGQPLDFSLSLNGFSAALKRLGELTD
jgi:invasion protein IalB